MIKVAIYARYSSDLQRESSIKDQVHMATQHAKREGWQVVKVYGDHAISGSSMNRPELHMMLQDAAAGQFDMVLTEGLDRISRDQEHVAGIYKKLKFAGVQIHSLGEGGIINELHIGLKGTMNQMFLKDLAQKVKRGITGQVLKGKHTGNKPYGYDIVRRFNEAGEVVRGERVINPEEAKIVTRIFEEFVSGKSALQIAKELNQEGVSSPKSNGWTSTTIAGRSKIGSGILNNQLLIGRIIWNRNKTIKDPVTEKRIVRPNPPEDWISSEVPELRIIPQTLWDKAKAKQDEISTKHNRPEWNRRAKTLLSGLLQCGCCGGAYNKMSKYRYYCSTARRKATCDNNTSIRTTELEGIVLSNLQNQLFNTELFETFCAEYTRRIAALTSEQNTQLSQAKAKLKKLAKQKDNIMQAIKDGLPAAEFKEELLAIADEREQLNSLIDHAEHPPATLKPDLNKRYLEEIARLQENMTQGNKIPQSNQLLQKIIQKIILTPNKDDKTKLDINVMGNFAGMLAIAADQDIPSSLLQDFLNEPS